MHFLIVSAHPSTSSYTQTVVDEFIRGIETSADASYEKVDLCAEGFDPVFSEVDYDFYYGRSEVPAVIRSEQKRIDRADALILVFPIYWWSMPALMKGWIDRVFTSGWAFIDDPDKGTTRLLGHLSGHVLAIGGSYRRTYERRGYLAAIEKEIVEGIFGYCGMRTTGLDLLLPMDADSAREGLQTAFEAGRRLAQGTSLTSDPDRIA